MNNVALFNPRPDPIADCEHAIRSAIDDLEAATGQQVNLVELLYTDEDGNFGQFAGQTHRCVMLAMDPSGPAVQWARGAA